MKPRERVKLALNHKEPDRVPLDLNATATSGMHVSAVYTLRQALGLDEPGTPVKVIDPFQMRGEVKIDLIEALGVDVIALDGFGSDGTYNIFGFKNEGWKPWKLFDNTPVLVPVKFNTDPEPNGDILMYPEGDKSVPPSGRMPVGGWYFDAIERQQPIDDNALNIEDNLEEFGLLPEETLDFFSQEIDRLYNETDLAIMSQIPGTAFGDIALVPAMWLKDPKGIRGIEEWYISTATRRDYVYAVFERQCEIALMNLEKFYQVVGNRVDGMFLTGTDFGTQNGPFISPKAYRSLFMPFHKAINDWIHENTEWKTFIHSCGSVRAFIPDFIEAGFDILNPVQTSAVGMSPRELKREYGADITFWGGGVDTQSTLPFGSPDEVRAEAIERIKIFGPGGGFVFNAIHNIQPAPAENLIALFSVVREYGKYPL